MKGWQRTERDFTDKGRLPENIEFRSSRPMTVTASESPCHVFF